MFEALLMTAYILAADGPGAYSIAPRQEFLLVKEQPKLVTQLTPHGAGMVSGHLVWLGMNCRGHTTAFASAQFELIKDRGKEFQRGLVDGIGEAKSLSAVEGIQTICNVIASKYGPDGVIPGLWKDD
jgi:hypothetical protein